MGQFLIFLTSPHKRSHKQKMASRANLIHHFKSSFLLSAIGLVAAAAIGYGMTSTLAGLFNAVFIVAILSVLEVSLSFDNAVVNATVLSEMNAVWRQRFLTWGIVIAVFFMRLVFPLAVVGIAGHLGPWDALSLAIHEPHNYERVLLSAHVSIAAYGGTFLYMVGLKYFFDYDKKVHWLRPLERLFTSIGRVEMVEIALTVLTIYLISRFLSIADSQRFLLAGLCGLLTYLLVDCVGRFLKLPSQSSTNIHRASLGMFLYLEVLDASFSFDGVLGAFALTNNLFLMMLGLGIGAVFVRSLTVLLVEQGTLKQYKYLEHGAFYAILVLALVMFASTFVHIPETFTGLIGGVLIGLSLWSSIRDRHAIT